MYAGKPPKFSGTSISIGSCVGSSVGNGSGDIGGVVVGSVVVGRGVVVNDHGRPL